MRINNLIPARRPNQVLINKTKKKKREREREKKRNCRLVVFADVVNHRVKIKGENIDKYLDFARELKKLQNMSDSDTNCSWCTWNGPQRLGKGTERNENQMEDWDHPDYRIVENSWRPEKTCCPSNSSEISPPDTRVKNL